MKDKVKRECNPEHRSILPAEWKEEMLDKLECTDEGQGTTLSHKLSGRLSRHWKAMGSNIEICTEGIKGRRRLSGDQ